MELLKSLLNSSNLNYIQIIDCEADDIIASFLDQITKIAPDNNFDILTRDKDLLQLLNERTNILKYIAGKITCYTQQHFQTEYKFLPENYVDYLSLTGDEVDNVKGVPGIGPVSSQKLIQEFHTVENIYQQLANLSKNSQKLLQNKQELVYINKKIISLQKNIPLPLAPKQNYAFRWEE